MGLLSRATAALRGMRHTDTARDPFGRLLVSPDNLPREARWDCLRVVANQLCEAPTEEARWLGEKLQARLARGGDLELLLGLRPPRGSTTTPERHVRKGEVEALLVRLANEVGSDVSASRVLAGELDAPPRAAALVSQLRELEAPASRSAFTRARRASSHGR